MQMDTIFPLIIDNNDQGLVSITAKARGEGFEISFFATGIGIQGLKVASIIVDTNYVDVSFPQMYGLAPGQARKVMQAQNVVVKIAELAEHKIYA